MAAAPVTIHWPNGHTTCCSAGNDWLEAAQQAGVTIPTGCLGGSCGACEIDVNGTTIRACIATVPTSKSGVLTVELTSDPYW